MGRDVAALKDAYPDPGWRARLQDIADLIEVLADCIVSDGYSISDDLNNAIKLSSAGVRTRDKLVRKENVPPKEATLMCALTLGHDDLFIDVDATDIDLLAKAIDDQVRDRRVLLPLIFGRELYDRYAELYEDERDSLSPVETRKFLDELPIGVFQYGRYTTGPYGLRKATTARTLRAHRRVPAFHCADHICRRVHSVRLETSHQAPINKFRPAIEELLRKLPDEPDDWWEFTAEISGLSDARYGDQAYATLLPLLGDALDDAELALLVAQTFNTSGFDLRQAVSELVAVGDAFEAVDGLTRAELLQLLLFAPDEVTARALDRLVRDGLIVVPVGEIRRPVVLEGAASGAFGLSAELGCLGVRFVSDNPGFPLLRLRRLLDKLYVREVETDVEELDWQLRGVLIDDLDERLDEFFRSNSPRMMLERLVLARKTNMIAACEEVRLDDAAELRDSVLIDTLLWKFGFSVPQDHDPHQDFWERHEQLWALIQSSDSGGYEKFRDAAAPYFACLEGLLLESLAFSAWALLNDHTASDSSFTFDDADDRDSGLALMSEIAPSPAGTASYGSGKVDLGNLVGGFSALARYLSGCLDRRGDYARPSTELPEYDGKTSIKGFVLRSTAPFIDLTTPSQERIVEGLKGVTKLLTDADVSGVRNDYAHYRRSAPEIQKLESALEAIRQAVTRLETLGLACLVYEPLRGSRDEWGRSVHEFFGPRQYEHRFVRPTRFDWMGLPSVRVPAILVRSASLGEPSEVLRFERRFDSNFSRMWADYPNRRKKQRTLVADESASVGIEPTVAGNSSTRTS